MLRRGVFTAVKATVPFRVRHRHLVTTTFRLPALRSSVPRQWFVRRTKSTSSSSSTAATSARPASGGPSGSTRSTAEAVEELDIDSVPPVATGWRRFVPDKAQLKYYWRSYGMLFLGTYFSVYGLTLAGFYAALKSELIKGPDVCKWLNENSWKKKYISEKDIHLSQTTTRMLTAWALTKPTEPARAAVTIMMLPLIVRYLPMRVLQRLRVTIPQARLNHDARRAASKVTK